MLKNTVISLSLLGLLAAASCGAAGQPGGLDSSGTDTLAPQPQAVAADSQPGSGPALPRGASAADGISYLVAVTQMKADNANDGAIEGEGGGGGDAGGGSGLGDLVQGIINWIIGEQSSGRTVDPHRPAALGEVGFIIWSVVEAQGGVLEQIPGMGGSEVLAVKLGSQPGHIGYATYGLREMQPAWRLDTLKLQGRGGQFYVGVSDYGHSAWQWQGPYTLGPDGALGNLTVQLPAVQCSNGDSHAYVTVVPVAGAEVELTDMSVTVFDPSIVFDPSVLDGGFEMDARQ